MEGISDIIELLVDTEASFSRNVFSKPWVDPIDRLQKHYEEVIVPNEANIGAAEASALGRVSVCDEYAPVAPIDPDAVKKPSFDVIVASNNTMPTRPNQQ